jgi:hypothetical protein
MNSRTITLTVAALALTFSSAAAFAQSPLPPVPKTDTVAVTFADHVRNCFFLEFTTSGWLAIPYNDVPAMAVVAIAQLGKAPVTYEVDPTLTCAGVPELSTVSSGVMH